MEQKERYYSLSDRWHQCMQDWVDQTDQFLSNNRRKVLSGKGRVSHEAAIEKASSEYEIFRIKQDHE